jgi:hypothetical protein
MDSSSSSLAFVPAVQGVVDATSSEPSLFNMVNVESEDLLLPAAKKRKTHYSDLFSLARHFSTSLFNSERFDSPTIKIEFKKAFSLSNNSTFKGYYPNYFPKNYYFFSDLYTGLFFTIYKRGNYEFSNFSGRDLFLSSKSSLSFSKEKIYLSSAILSNLSPHNSICVTGIVLKNYKNMVYPPRQAAVNLIKSFTNLIYGCLLPISQKEIKSLLDKKKFNAIDFQNDELLLIILDDSLSQFKLLNLLKQVIIDIEIHFYFDMVSMSSLSAFLTSNPLSSYSSFNNLFYSPVPFDSSLVSTSIWIMLKPSAFQLKVDKYQAQYFFDRLLTSSNSVDFWLKSYKFEMLPRDMLIQMYDGCSKRPWGNEWISYLQSAPCLFMQFETNISNDSINNNYIRHRGDFIALFRDISLNARNDSMLLYTRNLIHCPENEEESIFMDKLMNTFFN